MDIEKLTKSQIVLLTLLVSFVTSIATGIVTVSLMQQAPPAIAQTVNRVIEHTIETVASTTPKGQASAATAIEKTVVVNESDLIAQAVKTVAPSIVHLYSADDSHTFLGLGVVIDAAGTVVTDGGVLDGYSNANVETSSGSVLASVTTRDSVSGLFYLSPATSTAIAWVPALINKSSEDLGTMVVAISGKNSPHITQGIITAIDAGDSGSPAIIETNVDASSILPGTPLIDTQGNVIGVRTSVSGTSAASGFVPAALIVSAVNKTNVTKSQN
ncbi:MAG TPA: trypsin-like peptidase domain-containing protein [Candidatus Paceibacterota bacterium]|nr:trypsin-like peptidase domain-containing protein [Candidatus Paceibacterota bacterium]